MKDNTNVQCQQKDPGIDNAYHSDDAHNYKETLKETKKEFTS